MHSCFLFVFASDLEGLLSCLGFLFPSEPFRDSFKYIYMFMSNSFIFGCAGCPALPVGLSRLRQGGLLCCGAVASLCRAQTPGNTGFSGCGARAGSRMCDCQDFLFSVQIVMKLELLEDTALWGPFSDSHELEVSGMTENGELEGRT